MRLLHTSTLEFREFSGRKIPPYCILSHTWGNDEISYSTFKSLLSLSLFTALLNLYRNRPQEFLRILKADGNINVPDGFVKVLKFCQLARAEDCEWAWVDSCCINKESSAELSEAINSMYRWYEQAQVCWAHLEDVSLDDDDDDDDEDDAFGDDSLESAHEEPKTMAARQFTPFGRAKSNRAMSLGAAAKEISLFRPLQKHMSWRGKKASKEFKESRWFTRGFTLQELLAPINVKFCDRSWRYIGNKVDLSHDISEVTRVSAVILASSTPTQLIAERPIAERMSWAANRETTRIEDTAYCLLGIFGIHMSLLYGEGEKAFQRLQKKILKTSSDETIFAWDLDGLHGLGDFYGILAPHPSAFLNTGDCSPLEMNCDPVSLTSRGVGFSIYNHEHLVQKTLRMTLPLNCTRGGEVIGICTAKLGGKWYRVIEPEQSDGLRPIGQRSTAPILPSGYSAKETLHVSMNPSPIPTTDLGIGAENAIDITSMENNFNIIQLELLGVAPEDRAFVALRFTTHFIPWPILSRSIDNNTAIKILDANPDFAEQGSFNRMNMISTADTGKEVSVGPQTISHDNSNSQMALLDSLAQHSKAQGHWQQQETEVNGDDETEARDGNQDRSPAFDHDLNHGRVEGQEQYRKPDTDVLVELPDHIDSDRESLRSEVSHL